MPETQRKTTKAVTLRSVVNNPPTSSATFLKLLTPDAASSATIAALSERNANALPTQWLLVLYLEADRPGEDFSFGERILDSMVQNLQPSPSMTHVELAIPATDASGDDLHFATYLGSSGAAWSSEFGNGRDFYLNPKKNGASWRAVPVCIHQAAKRARTECQDHAGTPYPSFARLLNYPFSVPPLRALAGHLENDTGTPAHCAALTARVLQSAFPELGIPNPSPWYGPATLYLELSRAGRMAAYESTLRSEATEASLNDVEDAENALEILLRGSDDDVRELSEASSKAGMDLACKKCIVSGVSESQRDVRAAQMELARAFLRNSWVGRPHRLKMLTNEN